jgi:Tol biopolymer transport system component
MKHLGGRGALASIAMAWLSGCSNQMAQDPGSDPRVDAGADSTERSCIDELPPDLRARSIAFDSDREDFIRHVYVMRADGTNVTRVTGEAYAAREPSFHPDGASMTFTVERYGISQIYFMNGATREVMKVTSRPEGADQSSISRDGAWVAYHSGPSVYVSRLDGSGEKLVATGLDDYNAYFWPHFSADDSELVFDRNNEIDAAKIDGSGFRQIVQNSITTIKSPAVSPDGRELAYDVHCDPSGESVWTTPFGTKTEPCGGRRVSPVGATDSQRPAWGSSTYLAYEVVDASTNLASIAVMSRQSRSTPCVLTAPGGDNRNPTWSP